MANPLDIVYSRMNADGTGFDEKTLVPIPNYFVICGPLGNLTTFTGSFGDGLGISASYSETSSYSTTASFALNAGGGTSLSTGSSYPITSSFSITASFALNAGTGGTTLTTGSTYPITSSHAVSSSWSPATGLNIDGGQADSVFGVTSPLDCGGA